MNEKKVYLAGAIAGLTAETAQDWREYAMKKLALREVEDSESVFGTSWIETGIVGYSPMRAKEYLASAGVLTSQPDAYDDYVLSSAKGITARDSWDVRTSDLILVNLMGAEKVSVGTVLEIGMAYALNKPIVAAWEEDNIHNHPMVNTMVGWICPDLDFAIDITKAILLPSGVKVAA